MTYFKDFNKDVKDMLTKNYTDAGVWKAEGKLKGPKDQLFINVNGSSTVNVDAEYNPSCCGAKVKVNVDPSLAWKVTASYEEKGHKVEVVTDKALNYEVSYDGKLAGVAINEKLTKKGVECGVAYGVAKHCEVGAGVNYSFKESALKWTLGARYACCKYLVSIQTTQLEKYLTGLSLPVNFAGKTATVAAQVECGKGAFAATVGTEIPCPLLPGNALRVRVTDKLAWSAAYIAKLPNSIKAAISVDAKLKPGLTVTSE
jgi:hypothetical protein